MTPRVFTVAEVDALIPHLADLIRRQQERQTEIEESLAAAARLAGGLPKSLSADETDSSELAAAKQVLRERISAYEAGWHEIRALGAVVKDAQAGLVDFYGRIDGRLVWLCWRYGEQSLRYYHDLDAGFAGRRRLRPDMCERLPN